MATTFLNTKIIEVENKSPDASGLATTAVHNAKVGEVENKTPNHDKYITSPEFNELTAENFLAKCSFILTPDPVFLSEKSYEPYMLFDIHHIHSFFQNLI